MMRGGRGRQETKVSSETLGKHGRGREDNEEVTVLHLEHEVKKVCLEGRSWGDVTPNPRVGHTSGNSCLVLVAEAVKSAMTELSGGRPREPGLCAVTVGAVC